MSETEAQAIKLPTKFPGDDGEDRELVPTVTVMSSAVARSLDGPVAIVLRTKEAGALGIQMTEESCAVLKCQIAIAETMLHPKRKR